MTGQRRTRTGEPRTLETVSSPEQTRSRAFPSGVEEAELVADARRGDESAFAFLVDRYGPMVFSLAYASTLSRSDAEDVAQETFLVRGAAWRGFAVTPPFRPGCTAWRGVAAQIVLDAQRCGRG